MDKQKVRKDPLSTFLRVITQGAMLITVGLTILIIGYIVLRGLPHLKWSLFSPTYNTETLSLLPALINTVSITLLALLFAVPVGIFAAIYLVEYVGKENRLVKLVRIATETLSGVPSIVYGLFGMLFFVTKLQMGFSILAGSLTLGLMILPTIMRTTEEGLMSVPRSLREGSYALGAGKLRTIFIIVLPVALPTIFSGIMLSIGRIVGETAAVIYTAGTVAEIALSPSSSGRTLAIHMYSLSQEGLYMQQAQATALVLLVLVIILNTSSTIIEKKFSLKGGK